MARRNRPNVEHPTTVAIIVAVIAAVGAVLAAVVPQIVHRDGSSAPVAGVDVARQTSATARSATTGEALSVSSYTWHLGGGRRQLFVIGTAPAVPKGEAIYAVVGTSADGLRWWHSAPQRPDAHGRWSATVDVDAALRGDVTVWATRGPTALGLSQRVALDRESRTPPPCRGTCLPSRCPGCTPAGTGTQHEEPLYKLIPSPLDQDGPSAADVRQRSRPLRIGVG